MTTPTRPLSDRTVTPLYDQELENLLDGEVVCGVKDCELGAVVMLRFEGLCACRIPDCATHAQVATRVLREAQHNREGVGCATCNAVTFKARTVTIIAYPI